MFKRTLRTLFNNYYLILGIIVGLFANLSFIEFDCTNKYPTFIQSNNYSTLKAVLHASNATRDVITKKPAPIRSRYYSTELGIREKLFVAILTSEEKLDSQSAPINRTVAHLVDKIKFFMTAPRRTKGKNVHLNGLVGFTDSRLKLRVFQVIKHICDNSLQDYDFYYIANDFNYIDARRLKRILSGISVSEDVYVGNTVPEASYCDLDGGILFSNSVLQAVKENIEWCVSNAVTSDSSENLGRCIYHSTRLECSDQFPGNVKYSTFKVKSFDFLRKFRETKHLDSFKSAISVYPVLQKEDFYLLHSYFSKLELLRIKQRIAEKSESLSNWPPGEHPETVPATRFDLPHRFYFNATHIFAPDDFTNIRKHRKSELIDLRNILDEIQAKVGRENPKLTFSRLKNGYKVFDLGRGLDYTLDLVFNNEEQQEIHKRFEICKPLGNSEFMPAPYVTENTKVTILVPVEEEEVENEQSLNVINAKRFLNAFDANVLQRKDKVLVLLVFLYQNQTPSKGPQDPFGPIKELATKLSAKYRSEDTKVAWVSIRLPPVSQSSASPITLRQYPVLVFPVIELSLRKVGIESLVLVLSVDCVATPEFINRVRMNTVSGFQIFSVIPFRFYDPSVAHYDTNNATTDSVHKNSGHFDKDSYQFISFYGRDYVHARKQSKHLVPLVRNDNDIERLLISNVQSRLSVFEMFVQFSNSDLHCLRAPDANLRIAFRSESSPRGPNWFLGTRTQLARAVLLENSLV